MNIAIIGYGQMGKEIEKISVSRGHKIGKIIDVKTENKDLNDCDAAIIFTTCLLYTSDAADDLTPCRSRWSPYH